MKSVPHVVSNPRDLVYQVLFRWTVPSDPPFLPERGEGAWAKLSPRDRAFGFDLLTGIMRWRGTLDAVIGTRLKQRIDELEHPVRVVLWLGAYQVLFQGTANYAAVDTAVDMARRVCPRAGGLVNAVLRAITRLEPRRVALEAPAASAPGALPGTALSRRTLALDFETELRFNEDVFFDPVRNPAAHLAAVRSHPLPFVGHLLKLYPLEAAAILLANNQRPVVTLRVDAGAIDAPATAGLTAHEEPRYLIAAEGWNEWIEQQVEAGKLSPQDPTASKPVRDLTAAVESGSLPPPTRILDLCAGLGTKTVQLARAFPAAQIVATDIDSVKLARLANRVSQLKLSNVQTQSLEEASRAADAGTREAVVLLDVPCSNTGVFAKRVQSRWRWPTLDHAALAQLQMKLLHQGAAFLAEGGTLLYATCSIDPAENQDRVAAFLKEVPAFNVIAESTALPSRGTAVTARRDGGYFAILRR